MIVFIDNPSLQVGLIDFGWDLLAEIIDIEGLLCHQPISAPIDGSIGETVFVSKVNIRDFILTIVPWINFVNCSTGISMIEILSNTLFKGNPLRSVLFTGAYHYSQKSANEKRVKSHGHDKELSVLPRKYKIIHQEIQIVDYQKLYWTYNN